MRDFVAHFRETWHEGGYVLAGYGWHWAGFPDARQCTVGFCRLAWETGKFWFAAMLAQ